jgi:hypothetical protein
MVSRCSEQCCVQSESTNTPINDFCSCSVWRTYCCYQAVFLQYCHVSSHIWYINSHRIEMFVPYFAKFSFIIFCNTRCTLTPSKHFRSNSEPNKMLWQYKYTVVAVQVHRCGSTSTPLRQYKYTVVAVQVHRCGSTSTPLWQYKYTIYSKVDLSKKPQLLNNYGRCTKKTHFSVLLWRMWRFKWFKFGLTFELNLRKCFLFPEFYRMRLFESEYFRIWHLAVPSARCLLVTYRP